jgi:diguanylate cyclase (GGDEF)-like protein/PAS domain S-box-containing protein
MEASPEKSLRLLLIDDDEDEYIVLKSLVAGVDRIHFEVDWVDSAEKALQIHPDAPYDVLLVDYRLGAVNGLDIVEEFVRRGLKTPIILLTGQGNYEIDEAAQQAGAADYLAKDGLNFSILERTIRYAMEHKNTQAELERRVQERTQALYQEMGERQQAQEATRLSEARFRALAETTSAAIFITREMEIRYANPAAKMVTGYEPGELVTKSFLNLAHPDYRQSLQQQGLRNPWAPDLPFRFEVKIVRRDGAERWLDLTTGPIEYENGPACIVTAFDITERDIAEAELRRARDELEERVGERTMELRHSNEKLQIAVEESHKRMEAIDSLRNATSMLLSTIELENLLGHIVDAAQHAIPAAETASLHLLPMEGVEAGPVGDSKDKRIHIEPLGKIKGHPARAIRSGKPVLVSRVPDSEAAASGNGGSRPRRNRESAIAAPLMLEGKPLGALLLTSNDPGAFLKADLELLQSFAATAAVAIRNARLHGQVQQWAVTDPLTGALNRRGFFEISERELERFHRYGHPLSILYLDVDKFKSFNDRYGHLAGDRVLQAVVDRSCQKLRHMDVMGRLGGDEFAILLPVTSLARARKIAERVRRVMTDTPVAVGRRRLQISITVGVTTARAETPTLKALLEAADKAFYEAKEKGRNQVAAS